jgi:hypothetical protein
MDEKTAATEPRAPGCFFCSVAVPFLEQLWPQTTREHFRNSRVEFLKGIRSIIDARIDHLSREHQKGTPITVE